MRKNRILPVLCVIAMFSIVLSACSLFEDVFGIKDDGDSSGGNTTITNTFLGGDNKVFRVENVKSTSFKYILDLGSSTKDVYFIITNTDLENTITEDITISINSNNIGQTSQNKIGNQAPAFSDNQIKIFKDIPAATSFNNKKHDFRTNPRLLKSSQRLKPQKNSVGESLVFNVDDPNRTISATLRGQVSNVATGFGKNKTLNIWVENDFWTAASEDSKINQQMVDLIAAKFLKNGLDNDIYDWVSSIYGEEWGQVNSSDVISETNQIDILLFDIDNDKKTEGSLVLGYFWAKDNFKSSKYSNSNQRIIFYIDALLFATKDINDDDGVWELSDYWPSEMISTLAHEFQHMINFYQKSVIQLKTPGSWINEMASMMAEDFIANKMEMDGPRGVGHSDKTSGSPNNKKGRLPLFNYIYDGYSVTKWENLLQNYAMSYSLGAYLARNYGGASLFTNIVQNSYEEKESITRAIKSEGSSVSFETILQNWAAAVLLSDRTSPNGDFYKFNSGEWFTSTSGGKSYQIGSINFFNYRNDINTTQYVNGPLIYKPISTNYSKDFPLATNRFFLLGTDLTGQVQCDVDLKNNKLKMQVVVK